MSEAAIEVEGLRKSFGDVVAVDGVDLEVPAGTVLGLLGPNGAGKTTIVRILTTILQPDGGTARVLGRDVAREPDAVRRRIGLAGQFAAVDGNLTGRENLRLIGRLTQMSRSSIGPRADELLESFGLTDAANRPARTYSGGMRRRLDVAAALVHRPPVLFLDEPTTGLDPQSRSDLWTTIRELVASGTTVLLTTQYLEEADRLASRIVVIDGGRVIAEGTASALKSKLGNTVVEIGFDTEADAGRGFDILSRTGLDPQRDGEIVHFATTEGARAVLPLLRALEGEGLIPHTLAVREPSLDDVFLTLTGHAAEPGPDGDAEGATNAAAPTGRKRR